MHGGSVDSQGLHSRRNPRALVWLDGPTWVDGRPSASVNCEKRVQISTTHDIMESKDDTPNIRWRVSDRRPDPRRRLCDQLCATVRVEQRPDGEPMLQAEFEFPDGIAI